MSRVDDGSVRANRLLAEIIIIINYDCTHNPVGYNHGPKLMGLFTVPIIIIGWGRCTRCRATIGNGAKGSKVTIDLL